MRPHSIGALSLALLAAALAPRARADDGTAVPPQEPAMVPPAPVVPTIEPAMPSTEPVVPSIEPAIPSTQPALPSASPAAPAAQPEQRVPLRLRRRHRGDAQER